MNQKIQNSHLGPRPLYTLGRLGIGGCREAIAALIGQREERAAPAPPPGACGGLVGGGAREAPHGARVRGGSSVSQIPAKFPFLPLISEPNITSVLPKLHVERDKACARGRNVPPKLYECLEIKMSQQVVERQGKLWEQIGDRL